jgi:hypothetical protein
MEELDRDCGRYERRRGGSEWRPRGEDETRAEQLGLTDHGCDLRAATPGCNVSKSFTTLGKLRSIGDHRQSVDHSDPFLVDPLRFSHATSHRPYQGSPA